MRIETKEMYNKFETKNGYVKDKKRGGILFSFISSGHCYYSAWEKTMTMRQLTFMPTGSV